MLVCIKLVFSRFAIAKHCRPIFFFFAVLTPLLAGGCLTNTSLPPEFSLLKDGSRCIDLNGTFDLAALEPSAQSWPHNGGPYFAYRLFQRATSAHDRTYGNGECKPGAAELLRIKQHHCGTIELSRICGDFTMESIKLHGNQNEESFRFSLKYKIHDANMVIGPSYSRGAFYREDDGSLIVRDSDTTWGLCMLFVPFYSSRANWYRIPLAKTR